MLHQWSRVFEWIHSSAGPISGSDNPSTPLYTCLHLQLFTVTAFIILLIHTCISYIKNQISGLFHSFSESCHILNRCSTPPTIYSSKNALSSFRFSKAKK